jgi:hypothetical protein
MVSIERLKRDSLADALCETAQQPPEYSHQELLSIRERIKKMEHISSSSHNPVSTAIGLRKHRIPFDLRS